MRKDYIELKEVFMRTQDIVLGCYYRYKVTPTVGYARAVKILKSKPLYKCTTDE